jgi:hypothetical protein
MLAFGGGLRKPKECVAVQDKLHWQRLVGSTQQAQQTAYTVLMLCCKRLLAHFRIVRLAHKHMWHGQHSVHNDVMM